MWYTLTQAFVSICYKANEWDVILKWITPTPLDDTSFVKFVAPPMKTASESLAPTLVWLLLRWGYQQHVCTLSAPLLLPTLSLFTQHEMWYQEFIAPAPTKKHRTHLLREIINRFTTPVVAFADIDWIAPHGKTLNFNPWRQSHLLDWQSSLTYAK